MKTRILAVMAALTLLAASPARAGHGHGDAGWWALGGFVAGAVTGAAIASSSNHGPACATPFVAPAPVVIYAPPRPAFVRRPGHVFVAPAPVVLGRPPVLACPAPVACPPPVVVVVPRPRHHPHHGYHGHHGHHPRVHARTVVGW